MNSQALKGWRKVLTNTPGGRFSLIPGMTLLLSVLCFADCVGQGLSETLSDAKARDARGESLESIAERELRKRTSKPSVQKTAQNSSTKTDRSAQDMPSRLELWKRRRAAKEAEKR